MIFSMATSLVAITRTGWCNYRRRDRTGQGGNRPAEARRVNNRRSAMLDVVRKRRSVRSYHARDVEEEKLRELLKSAMFAPSSRGSRAWEFVVVRDENTRKALSEATPYSFFIKDAPVAIVVCYDTSRGRRFKEDASICAGHILLEAVNQGLGSCFVQVAEAEGSHGGAEDYIKELLGVPKEYRVQCMMPIGYAAEEHPEHSDAEFDESKVHRERFQAS